MVNHWSDLEYDPATGVIRNARLGKVVGSPNNEGYLQVRVRGTTYKAHRLAWKLYHGEWPKHTIDHINGDKADNRIENLRDVDHQTNMRNTKRGKCGVLGVAYCNTRKKYQVKRQYGRLTRQYGRYDTLCEATRVARCVYIDYYLYTD